VIHFPSRVMVKTFMSTRSPGCDPFPLGRDPPPIPQTPRPSPANPLTIFDCFPMRGPLFTAPRRRRPPAPPQPTNNEVNDKPVSSKSEPKASFRYASTPPPAQIRPADVSSLGSRSSPLSRRRIFQSRPNNLILFFLTGRRVPSMRFRSPD